MELHASYRRSIMKKIVTLACSLVLVAAAATALPPGNTVIQLSDILRPSETGSLYGAGQEVSFAANNYNPPSGPTEMTICSAIANCGTYPNASCSTDTTGATCQAVDRNCAAGERGYARCGSTYTYCPVCPSTCTEGATRWVPTGYCCYYGGAEKEQEQCISGEWQPLGSFRCGISAACPPQP
jgi:hypothetical protein